MFVVIWEFHVKLGFEKEFEKIYGPEGEWAQFFKQGKGYLKTDLLRDVEHEQRFITLDYWNSQSDFKAFHHQRHDEYEDIDLLCDTLREREARIGGFVGNEKI